MVLTAILQKPEVKSVLVIEKCQDVLDLVASHVPAHGKRLGVVCSDILEWKPPEGQLWDTIYLDIWPTICGDNARVMSKLRKKFSPRLNSRNQRAWIGCWSEHRVKAWKRKAWGRVLDAR